MIAFFVPLREQNFTSTGLKDRGLWLVPGGFWFILCLSVFQSLLLVIILMTGSTNCEGGFWTLESVCLWKSQLNTTPIVYIHVPCTVFPLPDGGKEIWVATNFKSPSSEVTSETGDAKTQLSIEERIDCRSLSCTVLVLNLTIN